MATATTTAELVREYEDDVLSGRVPAGTLVRRAVERQRLDMRLGSRRGLVFDEDAAADACAFYPLLCHTTGEYSGQPFELRRFQSWIVWVLFGWHREDGRRRFRHAFLSLGRGNGKSPFAAATMLQLVFADLPTEDRAEGYCFATKRDQAKIVFEEAKRMVENCPALRSAVTIHRLNMYSRDGSTLQPMGSDSKNTDGLVPHACVLDELHEWRDEYRPLYDKIETAMGKRRQPMMLAITTAGDDRSHLWLEMRERSDYVLSQVVSPPERWVGDDLFAYVAEVDQADDVFDEGVWAKANPMLAEPDSPVKIDHLRSMASKAKGNPLAESRFRRYHCNQLVRSVEKPIPPELFAKGRDEPPPLATGEPVYVGLDLARSRDMAAVAIVQPYMDDGVKRYGCRVHAWTCEQPGEDLQQSEAFARVRLADNVEVHPGNQIDYGSIRSFLLNLAETSWIKSIAFDDNWARETGQWMVNEAGLPALACPQTSRAYNEPVTRFLEELAAGRISHGNDPVLAWFANNLVVRTDARGLKMPDKLESKQKIDGMVALLMAFREALMAPEESNYYDDNDLEVI